MQGIAMLDVPILSRVRDDSARLVAEIDYSSAPMVRSALAGLGRTEDIRFSPDNRLAALAGYGHNSCMILTVQVTWNGAEPSIHLHDFFEIKSPAITDPHGFDFIGNGRLLVANRNGALTVFRLPPPPYDGKTFTLEPEQTIRRTGFSKPLRTPGSVAVVKRSDTMFDIFACNTFHHQVTAHRLRLGWLRRLVTGHVAAEAGLDVPDGVAVSPDKRFMAISNHNNHCVSIFDLNGRLGPDAPIAGTLTGINYPHGLRFSPDGSKLYVADAGAPSVHRFDADNGNWARNSGPAKTVQVLSEQVFQAGRKNPQEGGPKGLDLDRTGRIMALTCEEQPLAFFNVEKLFG